MTNSLDCVYEGENGDEGGRKRFASCRRIRKITAINFVMPGLVPGIHV